MTLKKEGELSLVELCAINRTECYSPLQTVFRIYLTYSTKCCTQDLTFWCPPGEFPSIHLTPHGWTITSNYSSSNDRKPFTMAAQSHCCTNSIGMLLIMKRNRARPRRWIEIGTLKELIVGKYKYCVKILLKIVNYWPVGGRFKKRNRAIR